jgi:hypothetical protein
MRRIALGIALALLSCAGPVPRGKPIAADLLCSGDARRPERRLGAADLARCGAAVAPRIEAMKRAVLDTWVPRAQRGGSSFVQIQFSLDASGAPVGVCVLGGTGDEEARSALAAIARYQSPSPLSEEEQCIVGEPLVASLITEGLTP